VTWYLHYFVNPRDFDVEEAPMSPAWWPETYRSRAQIERAAVFETPDDEVVPPYETVRSYRLVAAHQLGGIAVYVAVDTVSRWAGERDAVAFLRRAFGPSADLVLANGRLEMCWPGLDDRVTRRIRSDPPPTRLSSDPRSERSPHYRPDWAVPLAPPRRRNRTSN
jgi:hypothetical protein